MSAVAFSTGAAAVVAVAIASGTAVAVVVAVAVVAVAALARRAVSATQVMSGRSFGSVRSIEATTRATRGPTPGTLACFG